MTSEGGALATIRSRCHGHEFSRCSSQERRDDVVRTLPRRGRDVPHVHQFGGIASSGNPRKTRRTAPPDCFSGLEDLSCSRLRLPRINSRYQLSADDGTPLSQNCHMFAKSVYAEDLRVLTVWKARWAAAKDQSCCSVSNHKYRECHITHVLVTIHERLDLRSCTRVIRPRN